MLPARSDDQRVIVEPFGGTACQRPSWSNRLRRPRRRSIRRPSRDPRPIRGPPHHVRALRVPVLEGFPLWTPVIQSPPPVKSCPSTGERYASHLPSGE